MLAVIQAVGGVGVFLLGMVVMTEGLKSLAGAKISRYLVRATRSPWSGAVTGAASTAILQSSSATTVAAVGFVGAGLLSFEQALGIIFGANIGTTITGWMVVLLGFKLQLGSLMLPVIFAGMLLRLFARQRLAQIGYALAGFGLIFVGIDLLQQAAADHTDLLRLDVFPPDSLYGRLLLLGVGMAVTVITQSSSAGVAAVLVMLNAGAIAFEQAAALVIGMDVGTSVTAAMAGIGGSISARRTGFSHVIYNVLTGLGALILITPYSLLWELLAAGEILRNSEIALVAFHTSFNVLGVLLVLPFSRRFVALIEKIVPDTRPRYARSLDKSLLKEPNAALMAVEKIIVTEFLTLMVNINLILRQEQQEIGTDMYKLQLILNEAQDYLDQVHIRDPQQKDTQRLIGLFHAIDHIQRLHERCDEDLERAISAGRRAELTEVEAVMDGQVSQVIDAVEAGQWDQARSISAENFGCIRDREEQQREKIYRAVAQGEMDVPNATECVEALRWLTRVSRHIARICFHLERANQA